LHRRDREETSSSSEMEVLARASCISTPSTGPPQNLSPWIRDAPHSGFSWLIRRIRSRNSRSILGRPTRLRDFQHQ
jgi:hypothetical protein